MISGVGLYTDINCTQAVSEQNGKFVLDLGDVLDFGKTLQLWVKNMYSDRNLKGMYCLITSDDTLSVFGSRYVSLSNSDGSEVTQDKLYLTNQDMTPGNKEMIQVIFSPELGITNMSNIKVTIVFSNHVINVPVFN